MAVQRDDAERIEPRTLEEWRAWLEANHATSNGVWLVSWKKSSGRQPFSYDDAVTEALRFGWIDSLARSLDDDRSLLWYGPRRAGSAWSRSNKQRVARLEAEGRLEPAGRAAIRTAQADGSWNRFDDVEDLVVPDDLAAALARNPAARSHWDAFPASARRAILFWIAEAKRPETRARRVEQAVADAGQGRRAR